MQGEIIQQKQKYQFLCLQWPQTAEHKAAAERGVETWSLLRLMFRKRRLWLSCPESLHLFCSRSVGKKKERWSELEAPNRSELNLFWNILDFHTLQPQTSPERFNPDNHLQELLSLLPEKRLHKVEMSRVIVITAAPNLLSTTNYIYRTDWIYFGAPDKTQNENLSHFFNLCASLRCFFSLFSHLCVNLTSLFVSL